MKVKAIPYLTKTNGIHQERLEVMLQQEESVYNTNTNTNTASNSHTSCSLEHVVTVRINKAVAAMEEIFNLCRLQHHDTLVIAASYLCRYMANLPSQNQQQQTTTTTTTNVELVALVCFYLAVKIHEPAALPLRTLGDLYRRFFFQKKKRTKSKKSSKSNARVSTADLQQVELDICRVLHWRLNPPTARAVSQEMLGGVMCDKVRTRLEAAFRANPVAFVHQHRPSWLAMAAIRMSQEGPLSLLTLIDHHRATPGVHWLLDEPDDDEDDDEDNEDDFSLRRAMDFVRQSGSHKRPSSPPALADETEPSPRRKKFKSSPPLSASGSSSQSLLAWMTGSPRSALAMAQEQEQDA